MRKTVLALSYVGGAMWLLIAVLSWLGALPLSMHPERWPIAAFGGMTLLSFGILFHQKFRRIGRPGLLTVLLLGFITTHPTMGQQLHCHDQKTCDLESLSRSLVEASLPPDPVDIVGNVFCAGMEKGTVVCGIVLDFWFLPDLNTLGLTIADYPPQPAVFNFKTKTWKVSEKPADWISISTRK